MGRTAGWVTVGHDHDPASCAVASLLRWWDVVGRPAYPQATRLGISADGGGRNGDRGRVGTVELHRFATTTGLTVTVCHRPPGTSTWTTIEHRWCAHISLNWRGRPLVRHEVIGELIGAPTTQTGLTVPVDRETGSYPTRVRVSDEAMATRHLTPHAVHGEWNYTIAPAPASSISVMPHMWDSNHVGCVTARPWPLVLHTGGWLPATRSAPRTTWRWSRSQRSCSGSSIRRHTLVTSNE